MTREALMQLLTGHADEVAMRVLQNADGGVDLAKDVKVNAFLEVLFELRPFLLCRRFSGGHSADRDGTGWRHRRGQRQSFGGGVQDADQGRLAVSR